MKNDFIHSRYTDKITQDSGVNTQNLDNNERGGGIVKQMLNLSKVALQTLMIIQI